MLEQLDRLSSDISTLIIYTNSSILQGLLKQRIKARLQIERNLTKYALTGKELKEIKDETLVPPFGGGTWLLDVQTDNIQMSDIVKEIGRASQSSVTIFWTTKYLTFKKLCELEQVKKQGNFCFTMYAGRLYPEDITYIQQLMLPPEKHLKKELLDYVKKNYTYDIDSVCELFQCINQDEQILTVKDIIEKVGIGGNTTDSFVMKLLTTNPKTEKGVQKSLENMLTLLDDLSYSYEYTTIRNYMRSCVKTVLEIKQLQILGKYSRTIKDIPEKGYNSDKIKHMRRFESAILEEINVGRVLNLKLCLETFNNYNTELSLIEAISFYLSGLYTANVQNPESKEVGKRRRQKY